MKRIVILIIAAVVLLMYSCTRDQIGETYELDLVLRDAIASVSPDRTSNYYILPDPSHLEDIPQDPKNPLTIEKISLGKMLFFETGFAMNARKSEGMRTYSCATCHIPEAGFKPNRPQGIADGGIGYGQMGENRQMHPAYSEDELDIQHARPLSVLNVAFVKNTFWNGQFGSTGINAGTENVWSENEDTQRNFLGYEGIETQNFEGVLSHRFVFNKDLVEEMGYMDMFDASFPDLPQAARYTTVTAALAISAYLRTLMTDRAPFQKWLKGDPEAMTVEEKKGGILFFGKAGCVRCHYEPNLGSLEFHALGVRDIDQHPEAIHSNPQDERNLGRGGFTGREEDYYKFKVPQLYNVSDSPIYFHGASKSSLEDVVDYFDKAEFENQRIPPEYKSHKFEPLDLDSMDKVWLVAFLSSALKDPELVRYQPAAIHSGQCFPNNDELSQQELGCN